MFPLVLQELVLCVWFFDGPIRANQFADSLESADSRESFQGSELNPLFSFSIALRGG